MAADVLARHMRQRGEDVFFLTGTDEHGEPIETAAEREGITPQELADRNAEKFRELMPIIDATNDFFIRTSDRRHKERVAEVIQRVYDNGWVTKGVYEGWYCPRCADFKSERELGPGQTCPIHEIVLEKVREENWFFKLSAFQERLESLYEERPDFVVPDSRRNEAVAFVTQGLEDVSLSRPTLKWGMELPWDPSQRMYVWFDALLNYYTALGFAREGEDLTERFWPPSLHVIGKDILKFHAVIWPALLMAAELELPLRMTIHGFLLMGEKKMSKSLGNVLDPFEVIDRFGADALRFYCFREVSFGQDGSISTAGFEARYETELANDYGNLASRVLAMVDRYRAGVVPEAAVDAVLAEDFEGALPRFNDLLDRFRTAWAWDHFVSRGELDDPVLECWTTLAATAARTRQLRVGSFVSNVMNRHPAVLARMAATLSDLSGGRLELGIGIGGHPAEHQAYGIPFPDPAERAAHLEEAVQVLRLLFGGGPVDFDGRFYQLSAAHAFPAPQPPPRITIGGEKPAGARLAARIGTPGPPLRAAGTSCRRSSWRPWPRRGAPARTSWCWSGSTWTTTSRRTRIRCSQTWPRRPPHGRRAARMSWSCTGSSRTNCRQSSQRGARRPRRVSGRPAGFGAPAGLTAPVDRPRYPRRE